MIGSRADLHLVTARDHHQPVIHRNFRTEARAALAQDAALAVQHHAITDRHRLGIVTLVQVEARPARSMSQGEVLQIAFTTFITDGTVERVIDEQKFQRSTARLLHLLGFSMHNHAFTDGRCTGRLRRLRHLLDLDKTHAARA